MPRQRARGSDALAAHGLGHRADRLARVLNSAALTEHPQSGRRHDGLDQAAVRGFDAAAEPGHESLGLRRPPRRDLDPHRLTRARAYEQP